MAIKWVIFDLGGVIIHWSDDRFYERISMMCGLSFRHVKSVFEPLKYELAAARINERQMVGIAMRKLKSDCDQGEVRQLWWKVFKQNAKTNHKIMKIMSKLKRNGYKLALLSNAGGYSHIRVCKKSWFKYMDKIIFSTPIGMAKPEKRIYVYMLKKLKAKPYECVFVDDLKKNVDAAKKLGIIAVHFRNAAQVRSDLMKLGAKL
jgi:epoxide hydrolase-like predicted phosphatase